MFETRSQQSEPRLFDLNIGDVLEHWEVEHAIREVIANALDESRLTSTSSPTIRQENENLWVIADEGRGLRAEHLVLDESAEKQANEHLCIGTFGVGLKDALAVFHRHDIEVEIESPHGRFVPRDVRKHGFDEIQTLHIACFPDSRISKGTEVRLRGVNGLQVQRAKDLFLFFSPEEVLEETRYGSILWKPIEQPGRVFIKGVLAAEEPDFIFSYDIHSLTASMKKKMSRERLNIGRIVYTPRVKAMLLEASEEVVLERLKDALLSDNSQPNELSWTDVAVHTMDQIHSSTDTVFVTFDQALSNVDLVDQAKGDGFKVVPIPERILEKAPEVRDLRSYAIEASATFSYDFVALSALSAAERDVLGSKDSLLRTVGASPSASPPLLISETLRSVPGDETRGVWDASGRRIIVLRECLESLEVFAEIFLHEIAHWRSGAADCTRAFESELSNLLARAAVASINQITTDLRDPATAQPAKVEAPKEASKANKPGNEGTSDPNPDGQSDLLGSGPEVGWKNRIHRLTIARMAGDLGKTASEMTQLVYSHLGWSPPPFGILTEEEVRVISELAGHPLPR